MPEPDLTFITTRDMLDELESRFDCMIFCATVNRTTENNEIEWDTCGGTPAALGLAEFIKRKSWDCYEADEQQQVGDA